MSIRIFSILITLMATHTMCMAQKHDTEEYYTSGKDSSGVYLIDRYEYSTGEKVSRLFSSEGTSLKGKRISGYKMSSSHDKILFETAKTPIYRRSYTARCYVYDSANGKITAIDSVPVMAATLSPDASRVAYCKDNDLYIQDLGSGVITRVTNDGSYGNIINGTADWVYEEEFAIVRMYEWSPSSRYISFVRFDESQVQLFDMAMFHQSTYPSVHTFKYPKAGYKNSDVSIHIYDTQTAKTVTVPMDGHKDYYIPRISWLPGQDRMIFTYMPRLQNRMDVYVTSPEGNDAKILWSDHDDAYINLNDWTHYAKNGDIIFTSERDGHSHLYIQNARGEIRQITRGDWDITQLYGISSDGRYAYIQSTMQGSENRDIASVQLSNGKIKTLSTGIGTHNASFSKECKYYQNSFSSTTQAPSISLHSAKDGRVIRTILSGEKATKESIEAGKVIKQISSLEISDSLSLKMWTMYPSDFDSTRKYPVMMYVYGGPGSQLVLNTWRDSMDPWLEGLVREGYIVMCVDGRGTGGRGAAFEKQVYRRMGELELKDQISAARKIGELPYVDKKRIGIFGWSFGGYMASLCATRASDVFSCAIAVAPVTSWRMYDTVYTERYLATPQENPLGYDQNSPLTYASDMKCHFLLVHGTADDNVHYQNSARFSSLLVEAGVPFEQMIYTDKNHSILGKARQHLYDKMTRFVLNHL